MTIKKKLVFISDIATPQQIKFCNALQKFYDSNFWFYESPGRTRGDWWSIELNNKNIIFKDTWFARKGFLEFRYFSPSMGKRLRALNPDIVILGGFSRPGNYFAYRWALKNGKKTAIMTERSRDAAGNLRKKSLGWTLISWLYRKVDYVLVTAEDIIPQFRDQFAFGKKVEYCPYAADLQEYLHHSLREGNEQNHYTYLFANRLTEIYSPYEAIRIFSAIYKKYPNSKFKMNAAGELRPGCETLIQDLGLQDVVEFLDGIQSWESLHQIYEKCDILIFPAKFSNGNFTILEAMASGMGIIISDKILGLGLLIQNQINGFVCESNIEDYVKAAREFILNPTLFTKHGVVNRSIASKFTPERVAERLNEILSRSQV